MRPQPVTTLRPIGHALPLTFAVSIWPAIAPSRARAGFVIDVQSVTAVAGSTDDTLNVTLTNSGNSAITVGGFAFEIDTGSGITFTAVDISITPAYIFAGHSAFGPGISVQPPNLPGTTMEAEDNYDTINSGISLGAGSTVRLGDVHFGVSATSSGSISIQLGGFPTTNISGASYQDLTQSVGTTFNGGIITVAPAAVPEPPSIGLLATALADAALVVRARGGKRAG